MGVETDMLSLQDRAASTLSGGERARMYLARALATDTPWLLADEPVASLDPAHALSVMTLFRKQASTGCGIVTVLHDLSTAARFCDRLILLEQGKIRADGRPGDVLTDDLIQDVYGISIRRVDNAVLPWNVL